MLIPHEFIYRGDLSAIGDFHSQCFVESLADGNIIAVYFKATGVTSFTGSWYFGLKVEGVNVLAGTDRPQITSGDLAPFKNTLSIAVNFGDKLTPTIDARGTGTINGPITVIIVVDDGLPAVSIGDPIGGATSNAALFAGSTGHLDQNAARYLYDKAYGNQGALKLGDTAAAFTSGIDKNVSLLQVADPTAYSGNLAFSYFGIWVDIVRGGNNSFFQTSAIRGRARYSGSSPDFPVTTGMEAFVDNQGSSGGTHSLQALEGNVSAIENANDIQGVAAFGSIAAGKAIAEFAIGILAQMTAGAGSSTPLLAAIRSVAGLGGTITDAVGIFAIISRTAAGVTTNLYGIKIEVDGSTGTVTNSYGIFIPAEIDAGSGIRRAIKSLSTALSEFAGPVSVPDDAYDATTWNGSTQVPTKNAVRDEIELLAASIAASALDSAVVHKTGAETITGVKTFSSAPVIPADAYGVGWNGVQEPAPKDAVYDKIESLVLGGGYTDEQAQDAIGAMLDTTLEYVDATPLLRRAALTGDVTAGAGSNATTIANNAVTTAKINNSAVTLAKLANIADQTILGNNTGGAASPVALTAAQVRTLLGVGGGTNLGVVNAVSNGMFLN